LDVEDGVARDEMGDLADLGDPTFAEWEWTIYRLRTPADLKSLGTRNPRVWIGKRVGPISLEEIRADYGGGWFEFWGKYGGQLKKRMRREIEGPPRVVAAIASSRVPDETNLGNGNGGQLVPMSSADRLLRALLREQRESAKRFESLVAAIVQRQTDDRFEKLLEAVKERPPLEQAKPPGIGEIIGAVGELRKMAGDGHPREQNPIEVAKMVLDGFHQGITLGQEREPIPAGATEDPNPMGPVILKGLEILEQMMRRGGGMRPGAPGAPGQPAPRPPSSATVVEPTAGPAATAEPVAAQSDAPPPPPDDPARRWKTALEAVYRGMVTGRDPADLAGSLPDILNEAELEMMRGVPGQEPTADDVLGFLGPLMGEYPDLGKTQGKVYLNSILAALRSDDSTES
jgi:hypothetical protein